MILKRGIQFTHTHRVNLMNKSVLTIALVLNVLLTACVNHQQIITQNSMQDEIIADQYDFDSCNSQCRLKIAVGEAKQDEMNAAIKQNSTISCNSKSRCDKIYRIASDIVVEYSDMKVQLQGENFISTYNPIDLGKIGIGARRTMSSGSGETVTLSVYCKGMVGSVIWEPCYDRVTNIYNHYKVRIKGLDNGAKKFNTSR